MLRRQATAFVVGGLVVLSEGCQLLIGLDGGHPRGTSGVGGTTSTTGPSSSSAAASSGSSGGATCDIGHLVISEIRSRGPGQSSDEFIELFNATDTVVTLDDTWEIRERAAGMSSYSACWTGKGKDVPAWGHYLIAGQGYTQMPAPDDADTMGVADAASLVLAHAGTTVDAVCYYYGSNPFNGTYTCEGTPVVNPHDMTTSTDSDASIERKPGGAAGNCTDTGDNADDFITQMPSTPENTMSPPTPWPN
jgi:hypothetical protein